MPLYPDPLQHLLGSSLVQVPSSGNPSSSFFLLIKISLSIQVTFKWPSINTHRAAILCQSPLNVLLFGVNFSKCWCCEPCPADEMFGSWTAVESQNAKLGLFSGGDGVPSTRRLWPQICCWAAGRVRATLLMLTHLYPSICRCITIYISRSSKWKVKFQSDTLVHLNVLSWFYWVSLTWTGITSGLLWLTLANVTRINTWWPVSRVWRCSSQINISAVSSVS